MVSIPERSSQNRQLENCSTGSTVGRKLTVIASVLVCLAVGAALLLHASHRYEDTTYMVVDAETLKSISGAEVSIEPVSLLLPEFLKLLLPNGDTGHTNSEGLVTLRVAKHDAGFLMAVNASDYEMTGDYPRKSSWLDAMSKVLPGQIAHIEWNHE